MAVTYGFSAVMSSTVSSAAVEFETIIPNPKLKLLDQLREVMRLGILFLNDC